MAVLCRMQHSFADMICIRCVSVAKGELCTIYNLKEKKIKEKITTDLWNVLECTTARVLLSDARTLIPLPPTAYEFLTQQWPVVQSSAR